MQNFEFEQFLADMGLPPLSFAPGSPVGFILNNSLELTLEYNEQGEIALVLAVPMPPYARDKLEKALRASSYREKRLLDFTAGYSRDKLLLLTLLPKECSALELRTAVEALIQQSELLEE